jgi:hypothetical protein
MMGLVLYCRDRQMHRREPSCRAVHLVVQSYRIGVWEIYREGEIQMIAVSYISESISRITGSTARKGGAVCFACE